MIARLIAALAITIALPVQAFELDAMSDDERAAFRAEVRAYLLDNPEVLREAITILQQRDAQAQEEQDLSLARANAKALFDDGHSFVGGNPDGDITVVEFLDYRCGYCKRAFSEVTELVNADQNIRFVIKELPILGEQSVLAARFAIATQLLAGDEAYKDVHDTLMELRSDINEASLARVAQALGLDDAAIRAKMDSDDVNAIIAKNRALAQRMQISGTPTFVIGDQMVRGYVELSQMEQIVAAVRESAADEG